MKEGKTEKPRCFHRFSKLLSNNDDDDVQLTFTQKRRMTATTAAPITRVYMGVGWPLYNDGQHRILCNNETPHQIFLEISTRLECDAGRIETQGLITHKPTLKAK